MGICNLCKRGITLVPQRQQTLLTHGEEQQQHLLPIRLKMSQETREVLNILIHSGYDLSDFVFCEYSGIIMSTIATVECDDFIFKRSS